MGTLLPTGGCCAPEWKKTKQRLDDWNLGVGDQTPPRRSIGAEQTRGGSHCVADIGKDWELLQELCMEKCVFWSRKFDFPAQIQNLKSFIKTQIIKSQTIYFEPLSGDLELLCNLKPGVKLEVASDQTFLVGVTTTKLRSWGQALRWGYNQIIITTP